MGTEKLLSGLGWRIGGAAALLLLLVTIVYALVATAAAFNSGLGL